MPDLMVRGAEPGYFAGVGIPLLLGRIFTTDERLARAHAAVIDGLRRGCCFTMRIQSGSICRINLGAASTRLWEWWARRDGRVSLPPVATLYWPIYGNDYSVATIVVRAPRNVESLAVPVQKVVAQLDADLPVSASAGTAQPIRSMFYATEPIDPAVFVAVAATLLLVAMLACMIPAWRASRLDPIQALRTE